MAKTNTEQKGRKGDEILAHLTPGEIVIPRAFAEDEDFRILLATAFKENGISLQEFIVGSGKNSINPKTGYMEFGWNPWKSAKKWVKKAWKNVTHLPKKTLKEIKKVISPDIKMPPTAQPEQAKKTAAPVDQLSGQAKKNKRLAASMLTSNWDKPKLGYAGLLGL